jgi:tRNA 2-thiouridine synthesizing protein E
MVLMLDDRQLETTDQGFLLDASVWTPAVAERLAHLESIELNEQHWEILLFMREYYQKFKHLPNARMFVTAIRKQLGEDKGNSRYLQKLFPQGPLKYACKIAGLPKPPTCF